MGSLFPLSLPFLFVYVNRCTVRESDAVGRVEGFQVYLVIADTHAYGHDGAQEFAVLARIEAGQRQLVPALLGLIVDGSPMAHFPDKIIIGFIAEPRFQNIADAEALILNSEEAPRALQLLPELHKAFLGVLDHSFKIDFDQMTLTK